jgi:SAM-dependent methyltransferase
MLPRSLRRRLSAVRRQLTVSPSKTNRQKAQLLSAKSLEPAQLALLAKVESRISKKDDMYVGDGDHYFKAGLSAIDCINEALQQAPKTTVKEILDLPCGYGRVLRFLIHRFPQARITACELMSDAVRFCAETFGIIPAQSSYNLDELSFPTKFDLIWCGSLITHLDADRTRALLRFFAKQLAADGLVVFTTHGDFFAARAHDMNKSYMLDRSRDPRIIRLIRRWLKAGALEDGVPRLVESREQVGYGYLDYPEEPGYGISLSTRKWIVAEANEAGLTEVYFRAQGWDNAQDVFGFVKSCSA